jgi:hypothetical protein
MAATDTIDFEPLLAAQDQPPPDKPKIDFEPLPEQPPAVQPSLSEQVHFEPQQLEEPPQGATGAFIHGLAKGGTGVAAGMTAAWAAEPLIAAASVAFPPAAPIIEPVGNIAAFLGGMILGDRIFTGGEKALSESSPTIKAYVDAANNHGIANSIGQFAAMGPLGISSLRGFYELATDAPTVAAAARAIGQRAIGGAIGGAGVETMRPAIEAGINQFGQALGLPPEEIQKPTVRSYLENMSIGMLLSGHMKGVADTATKGEAPPPTAEAPVAPEARAFTEPAIAQPQPLQTADVTRAILDQRNALINEAQTLRQQAEVSKAVSGTVPDTIQQRIGEINLELNQPSITPEAAARVIPQETAVYPPARLEPTPEAPVNAPGAPTLAPEAAGGVRVAGVPSEAEGTKAVTRAEVPGARSTPEPAVSELANKYTQDRVAKGQLGMVTPWGEVYSPEEMRLRGLRMGPEEINQHISDLVQNAGGDPVLQGAAVAANEARLRQRSEQLSRVAMQNPGDMEAQLAQDNAFKDLTDFQNGPLAKLKNQWATQGRGLQGSIPVDLSTHNGLRENWLRNNGKLPSPAVDARLKETARKVNGAIEAENGSRQRLGQEIDKAASRSTIPTADEVARRVAQRLGIEDPCR